MAPVSWFTVPVLFATYFTPAKLDDTNQWGFSLGDSPEPFSSRPGGALVLERNYLLPEETKKRRRKSRCECCEM
jgi:hypothetical protein